MTTFEANYIRLIKKIKREGVNKKSRNGITTSIFGEMIDLGDISEEFPILQGRQIHYKGVFGELAAMLNQPKNINDFKDHGCNYWDSWAKEDGSINIDYGNAWYNFNGYDQIAVLKDTLKNNPNDRRMIVTSWNPNNLADLDLPCCHMLYQFHVSNGKLNMLWTQRSVDTMIGLPSDAIFAAAWLIILANEVGLAPGNIKMSLGDIHIYQDHFKQLDRYLLQTTRVQNITPYHNLLMTQKQQMEYFTQQLLDIRSYVYQPAISFKLIK
jgi:thymidylate synthase